MSKKHPDTVRLDWISIDLNSLWIKHAMSKGMKGSPMGFCVREFGGEEGTIVGPIRSLRQAIDAAMKLEKASKK